MAAAIASLAAPQKVFLDGGIKMTIRQSGKVGVRRVRLNCRNSAGEAKPGTKRTSYNLKIKDDWADLHVEAHPKCKKEDIKKTRLITAIKTPYLPDGRFDLKAYDRLCQAQIDAGVDGLVVCGTTGEGHLMNWDEHIILIAHTCASFGDKVVVIGNTGSNCTKEAVEGTEKGFQVGMDCALQINPYYGKTSRQGILMHFNLALDMGPGILYNVPTRTGQDIPTDIVSELAAHPGFVGIKECSGNDRIAHYAQLGITSWSGNDDQSRGARWEAGGQGVISVTSNLVPGLMHKLMYASNDKALGEQLMPLMSWLFSEPSPIGLNTALALLGMVRPVFRLPYMPMSKAKQQEFIDIANKIGLQHFVGGKTSLRVFEDDEWVLAAHY
eukprot:jgi/Mesvir1/29668/Mv21507-RA.1